MELKHLGWLLASALLPLSVTSQTQSAQLGEVGSSVGKVMEARPVASGSINLDGRLDEEAWTRADFVSDFLQKEPVEGGVPDDQTRVAIVFTESAVYVGARMYSSDPSQIVTDVSRRDGFDSAERIIVSFDTFADRRTAYSFVITAGGTRLDWFHPEDREWPSDMTFDPVWEGNVNIDDEGWTAEMRIPLSQLRFNSNPEYWGVNFNRFIGARNEDIFWVVVPRDETGWASRMGRLTGVDQLNPSMRFEVLPYFASEATLSAQSTLDVDDPFASSSDAVGRAGADLKLGLGTNFTLDATINPDFGQVDADPAEVNLSAFETFFDERRPFFVEGSQLLQGSGPGYFYSRRIGGAPPGSPDADYVDSPGNSTILSAGKLTGRLPTGTSIAAISAITEEESARTFNSNDLVTGREVVAPSTAYFATRLQQEFGASSSTLGASFTNVSRFIDEGSPLGSSLPHGAIAGGVDWNVRWGNGAYDFVGYVGASSVRGSSSAIRDLQESSTHYFQRLDAEHVTLDTTATSLNGWAAELGTGKLNGSWLYYLGVEAISPGFDINDAGQLREADELNANAELFYRVTTPGRIFRNWRAGVTLSHERDFGQMTRPARARFTFNGQMSNYMDVEWYLHTASNGLSTIMTRGGPTTRVGGFYSTGGAVRTNFSRPVRGRFDFSVWKNPRSDWEGVSFNTGIDLRTSSRWQASLGFSVERGINGRQYVDEFDGGPAATNGIRYVISRVRQRTYSMNLRGLYSFTPDMSLEFYAEPFAASREFFGFGEVPEPRVYGLREYGEDGTQIERLSNGDYLVTEGADSFVIEDPDVNTLSFRSNLVLRWEWHPGSTLFLVWQQNNSIDDRLGRVNPGDVFESVTSPGQNFLALKFSYWLSL